MIEAELKCLIVLHEESQPRGEMCLHFRTIQNVTGYDRATVRRHVRRLKRKGFAEFYQGLCTEDGEFAGAGYCITTEGQAEVIKLDSFLISDEWNKVWV